MKAWGSYALLGETKDDAVGEAFDKVARMLGLPYPGGPEIARLAQDGNKDVYTLPRPMMHADNFDFSFSGLKTAVLYLVKSLGVLSETQKKDIARAFEDASIAVLVHKTLRAAKEFGAETIVVGGGVSANVRLKDVLTDETAREIPHVTVYFPPRALSTDNALMIAIAAAGKMGCTPPPLETIVANGNWRITQN
jgi:N6-L-threonylcarbamoyladenine synthase